MSENQIWTLFFVLLPALGAVLGAIPIYRRAKRDQNRYRFFAVRDNLIYLVADGKLKETDFLFKEFYRFSNQIVNVAHKITFKHLISGLKEDLTKDEYVQRIRTEIEKSDPEVGKVIGKFSQAVILAIHYNSLLFKIIVGFVTTIRPLYRFIKYLNEQIPRISWLMPNTFKDAYRIEKNLNKLCDAR